MWSRHIHTRLEKIPDISKTKEKYLPPKTISKDLKKCLLIQIVKTTMENSKEHEGSRKHVLTKT